jgi:lysozyme family protein
MIAATGFGEFGAAKKKVVKKTAAKTASGGSASAAKRLQAALVSLGKVVGSAKLKVVVDGAVGPKTVAAVNWAFTNHIGAGQAPADLRTGALTLAFVKANEGALADLIETEIARRGGTTASPATAAKGAAIQSIQTAPAASGTSSKADVKRLQTALVNLGKVAGSTKLKVAVDGAAGPKTVAAVNWAFTQHIGSGQAPADLRTGALDLAYIKGHAAGLAAIIETEVKRRGGKITAAKPQPVAKATKVKTKSGQTVKATKVATAAGETYEVEHPATGKPYYTSDPTVPPPPTPPEELPEATDEQHAVAAHAAAASTAAGRSSVFTPEQFSPSGEGGGSFFSEYKWPIIGGVAAVALIGIGAVALKRRPGSSAAPIPQQRRVRA